MNADRRAAVCAGTLFVLATTTNVIGVGLSSALRPGDPYLADLSVHQNRVTAGAFLELVAAGAGAGVAIALYRVLKRWAPGVALGSVICRAAEAVFYGTGVVALLSVLAVGRRFPAADATDQRAIRVIADSLLDVREMAALAGVLAFIVGALLYYWIFYRSRLVPRWLSGWGILAALSALIGWSWAFFGHDPVTTYAVLMVPIAVQEMVLAAWLIIKGFGSAPDPGRVAEGRRQAARETGRTASAWAGRLRRRVAR